MNPLEFKILALCRAWGGDYYGLRAVERKTEGSVLARLIGETISAEEAGANRETIRHCFLSRIAAEIARSP